jgi:hypothetical protein
MAEFSQDYFHQQRMEWAAQDTLRELRELNSPKIESQSQSVSVSAPTPSVQYVYVPTPIYTRETEHSTSLEVVGILVILIVLWRLLVS